MPKCTGILAQVRLEPLPRLVGIRIRAPRGRRAPKPAKETEAPTDFSAEKQRIEAEPAETCDAKPASRVAVVPTDSEAAKPANEPITDRSTGSPPATSPRASRCEPYRDVIEQALGRGRNAVAIWQELVDDYGFSGSYTSVRRFVGKLRGVQVPEARAVITTAPGEEAQYPLHEEAS